MPRGEFLVKGILFGGLILFGLRYFRNPFDQANYKPTDGDDTVTTGNVPHQTGGFQPPYASGPPTSYLDTQRMQNKTTYESGLMPAPVCCQERDKKYGRKC
jgi:hypothetical protein